MSVYEKVFPYVKLLFPDEKEKVIERPGIDWVKGFKDRYSLKEVRLYPMESERINMATTANVEAWFEKRAKDLPYQYKPGMQFNFDETTMNTKAKIKGMIPKEMRNGFTSEKQEKQNVTMLNVTNELGEYFVPLMIFQLKFSPKELDTLVKAGKVLVTGQKSGWIDQEIFGTWIDKLIAWVGQLRVAKGYGPDEPALFYCDGHSSRSLTGPLQKLKDKFIFLYLFPSHCSHILQPLDVAIYGPFKKYLAIWRRSLRAVKYYDSDGNLLKDSNQLRVRYVLAAINAIHQALVYTYVERGFRHAGLVPLDKTQPMSNHRIVLNDTVTMSEARRTRLPITGGHINSAESIKFLEEKEKQANASKKTKK